MAHVSSAGWTGSFRSGRGCQKVRSRCHQETFARSGDVTWLISILIFCSISAALLFLCSAGSGSGSTVRGIAFCVRSAPLHFGVELSTADHEGLLGKLISVFESDAEKTGGNAKVTLDALWRYRLVIQHWNRTVHGCAKNDLDSDTYTMVSDAMLLGDALDSQFCQALKSFPLEFGLTMLPDVKSLQSTDADAEEVETAIEKAEKQEWQAKLAGLEAKLEVDQRLLRQVNDGYSVLNDCLDWITTQKKLSMAKKARDVVQEHQDYFLPILELDDFSNLPGALETLLSSLPAVNSGQMSDRQKAETKKLIVFHVDFNVPGVHGSDITHNSSSHI